MSHPGDVVQDSIREIPSPHSVEWLLTRLGVALDLPIDRSVIHLTKGDGSVDEQLRSLVAGASQSGIILTETRLSSSDEVIEFVREGYPVVLAFPDATYHVLESLSQSMVEASYVGPRLTESSLTEKEVQELLSGEMKPRFFVAKKELECDPISSSPGHTSSSRGHAHHESMSPLRRFIGLLAMDRRDIGTIVLFAFVSGGLSLAVPLAIESLVNVVSWGTYLQPLLVLAMILMVCLGLAGILRILQTVVVEIIQRRQFVRVVGDLAHRFPRANRASLAEEYPRELANRVFDIMTIQKATAVLLLDGISIILTTILGMVLLAFYHPFLLGFDIVLLIAMISITWILGRGGIRTAIDESLVKYRVAHWLQEVIATPNVFKTGGGTTLASHRANLLTVEYINSRKRQFRVVIRQVVFAISLQIIASTSVLGLGGWLVIEGQLTLGQLVASELVVTVVVGAFAKAGKSLEKFYDLMAGIDKVGHLLDISVDPRYDLGLLPDQAVRVEWGDLTLGGPVTPSRVPAASIEAGSRVAIIGDDATGRSLLAQAIAGIIKPTRGLVQVAGFDAQQAVLSETGTVIGYAGGHDVFRGTLRENIDLGRLGIGLHDVREAVANVGLSEVVLQMTEGLQTFVQTGGYPLTKNQVAQLVIARAMVGQPKLLVIDGLLDDLDDQIREKILDHATAASVPWTLVIATHRPEVINRCSDQIAIRKH